MKRILLFVFVMFSLLSFSQTYVKVADKPEYTRYLIYCNTYTYKYFEVLGKVPVIKVGGFYADTVGNYSIKEPLTITWLKPGTTSITVAESEVLITTTLKLMVRKRTPSIPDFYSSWITHKIP